MNLLAAPKPFSCFYVWLKMVVLYINFECYCFGHSRCTPMHVLLRSLMFSIALYKMLLQLDVSTKLLLLSHGNISFEGEWLDLQISGWFCGANSWRVVTFFCEHTWSGFEDYKPRTKQSFSHLLFQEEAHFHFWLNDTWLNNCDRWGDMSMCNY